jgi:hypothetical protein
VAKDTQERVGKQLYEAKGPSQKTGIVTALKMFNSLFFRERRRMEMKLMMVQ